MKRDAPVRFVDAKDPRGAAATTVAEEAAGALIARQPAPRALSAHELQAIRSRIAERVAKRTRAWGAAQWAAIAVALLVTTSVGLAVPGTRAPAVLARLAQAMLASVAPPTRLRGPNSERISAAVQHAAEPREPAANESAPEVVPAAPPSPSPVPSAALPPHSPAASAARESGRPRTTELAREAESLRQLSALSAAPQSAVAALEGLRAHRARFPHGVLAAEADFVALQADVALGRVDDALGAVRGIEARGGSPAIAVLHGELLAKAGRCGEALARWAGALPADPDLAGRVLYGRASCFATLGDSAASAAASLAYVQRFPQGPFAGALLRSIAGDERSDEPQTTDPPPSPPR